MQSIKKILILFIANRNQTKITFFQFWDEIERCISSPSGIEFTEWSYRRNTFFYKGLLLGSSCNEATLLYSNRTSHCLCSCSASRKAKKIRTQSSRKPFLPWLQLPWVSLLLLYLRGHINLLDDEFQPHISSSPSRCVRVRHRTTCLYARGSKINNPATWEFDDPWSKLQAYQQQSCFDFDQSSSPSTKSNIPFQVGVPSDVGRKRCDLISSLFGHLFMPHVTSCWQIRTGNCQVESPHLSPMKYHWSVKKRRSQTLIISFLSIGL